MTNSASTCYPRRAWSPFPIAISVVVGHGIAWGVGLDRGGFSRSIEGRHRTQEKNTGKNAPIKPMISRKSFARLVASFSAFLTAGVLRADTSQALTELLKALVANKTLTAEQAALVQSAANEKPAYPVTVPTAENPPKPAPAAGAPEKAAPAAVHAIPKEKGITRLSIAGMLHPQMGQSLGRRFQRPATRHPQHLSLAPHEAGCRRRDHAAMGRFGRSGLCRVEHPRARLRQLQRHP